jgi:hypothetical protein
MAITPLIRPNGLVLPNRKPGFDPSHVAIAGYVGPGPIFSAACVGRGPIVSLVNPLKATVSGAAALTYGIDGKIGPCILDIAGGGQTGANTFALGPSTTYAAGTMAAILTVGSIGQSALTQPFAVGSGSGGPAIYIPTALTLTINMWGSATSTASITLTAGTPYFVCLSFSATSVNILALNLNNGKILTSTDATGLTATASNGTFVVGNNNQVSGGYDGKIAAVMWSPSFTTLSQMRQWALDPWAFWYPHTEFESANWLGVSPAATVLPPGNQPGNPVYELTMQQKFPAAMPQVQSYSWTWGRVLFAPKIMPPGNQPGNPVYELTLQQKWPSSIPQAQAYSWTLGRNPNLVSKVFPAGAIPGETVQRLPPGQVAPDQIQLRTWTWSGRPNLISPPVALPPGEQFYDRPTLRPQDFQTWVQSTNLALLAPTPFPRNQYDWPVPQAPSRLPDLYNWVDYLRFSIQILPPGNQLYDLPPQPLASRDIYNWIRSTNLALFAPPTIALPPGDQLYNLPLQPIASRDIYSWVQPTNIALLAPPTVALPPGEQLYALPPQPIVSRDIYNWIWPTNLALNLTPTAAPTRQQDWPVPTQPFRLEQTWTGAFNLNLVVKVSLPPGDQVTGLPPQPALRSADLLTWIQSVNLALTTAPPDLTKLARQQDWPVPRGAEPDYRRSWEWGRNPNLVSKAPTRQQDWPLPTAAQRSADLGTWINKLNPNFLTKPAGAASFDLSPRDFPRLLQTWIQSTSLALLSQPQPVPHNQYDWPLPAQHTLPRLLQTWLFGRVNLYPAPQFPPGEQFFDRPQLRVDTPADFYFIGQRPTIIPPPLPPAIGASYRLLGPHYLYGFMLDSDTIVTEGREIPFGWVPTLECEPLNTQAINAYYNAGPRTIAYENLNTYGGMYKPVNVDFPISSPRVFWKKAGNMFQLIGTTKPPVGV